MNGKRIGPRMALVWARLRQTALSTPGLRVLLLAMRNYILHQRNTNHKLAIKAALFFFVA